MAPPIMASITASIRICSITSRWRAPTALRMPISCVRSVTLTSMMFMITMPPTTSEMQVTGTTTAATMESNWSMKPRMASGVSVSKLSAWPGRAWKRVRSETRVRSRASSSVRPLPGLGRPNRAKPVPGPYSRSNAVIGNVDGIVLVAAERRAQLFLHADHREFHALDAHQLAERRRLARKQRGPHGLADDRHERAAAVFLRGEEAAIHHADVADAGQVGGRSQNAGRPRR